MCGGNELVGFERFIFICCMVITDLSIVIVVAIATNKKRKRGNWNGMEKY